MSKVYILKADPTRYGGIQKFCRTLAEFFAEDAILLAYYGILAHDRKPTGPLIRLNKREAKSDLSYWALLRNLALLVDIMILEVILCLGYLRENGILCFNWL